MQLFFLIVKVEFLSYYKYIRQKTCYKGERRIRQEVFCILDCASEVLQSGGAMLSPVTKCLTLECERRFDPEVYQADHENPNLSVIGVKFQTSPTVSGALLL